MTLSPQAREDLEAAVLVAIGEALATRPAGPHTLVLDVTSHVKRAVWPVVESTLAEMEGENERLRMEQVSPVEQRARNWKAKYDQLSKQITTPSQTKSAIEEVRRVLSAVLASAPQGDSDGQG